MTKIQRYTVEIKNMKTIYVISREIFYVLTSAMVIFTIMEIIWPNIVLAYLNLNWLLIFWLIIGIFILLIHNEVTDV